MSKLDLNTVTGLQRLMNEMNSVLENKIKTAKINEAINSINNFSFIECKQLFEGISDKLYDSDNGKKIIKKYTNLIKENNDLKTVYIISENIKASEKLSVDNPSLFVNESINYTEKINNKNFEKGLSELKKTLKEAVKYSKIDSEEFNRLINESKTLNESLNYIISNKKTPSNLLEYTNKLNSVINYVKECSSSGNTDENKQCTNDITELNELFSNDLELWENKAIEKITLSNIAGNSKESIFEEYKQSCLSLIDESLLDEDITTETKSRLSTMREQLEKKTYSDEKANEDILKLANFEYTLKS